MAEAKEKTISEQASVSKALTAPKAQMETAIIGGVQFKIKAAVTVPTLKQETGQTVFVRFDLPIKDEKQVEKKTVKVNGVDTAVEEEKTIHIARVTELQSGSVMTYVVNAVANDNLRDAYPNDAYVGKYFAITKGAVVAGKRYKDVTVVEIEVEEPGEQSAEITKVE